MVCIECSSCILYTVVYSIQWTVQHKQTNKDEEPGACDVIGRTSLTVSPCLVCIAVSGLDSFLYLDCQVHPSPVF